MVVWWPKNEPPTSQNFPQGICYLYAAIHVLPQANLCLLPAFQHWTSLILFSASKTKFTSLAKKFFTRKKKKVKQPPGAPSTEHLLEEEYDDDDDSLNPITEVSKLYTQTNSFPWVNLNSDIPTRASEWSDFTHASDCTKISNLRSAK